LTINGGTFDLNGNNLMLGNLSGVGGTLALGSGTLTLGDANSASSAAVITGTGGLVKQGSGTLSLLGVNTYTGPTMVAAGRLAVNGSITSDVTVGSGGNLGGSGTIFGAVLNNGIVSPGNSIGTLTVNGSYTQSPGSSYQAEANATGQADRINVIGAPGTATILGGTVAALPVAAGAYAPSTTYTILNATGGVTGTYAGVTSSLPFLQASLSYDANDVYLTLKPGGFARGTATANQAAVGGVLDRSVAGASGDFATVIGTMATLSAAQGQAVMDAISGQAYSGFGTANVQGGLAFMNVLGQQMSLARGIAAGATRVALAEACDTFCNVGGGPGPWSAWASALGATGSVAGKRQCFDLDLQYGRRGGRHGLPRRSSHRGRCGAGLCVGQPVGQRRHQPGDQRQLQWRALCQFQSRRLLPRCAGGLWLQRQPDAAHDPDPGTATAQRCGPRRRQSVRRPGRGRLQSRDLRARRGVAHAVRAVSGHQRQPGGVHRNRRQFAQPQRRATDDQFAAQRSGRPDRWRARRRLARQGGAAVPARLGA
jgi:autotransporter-associated beta strand protein